MTPDDVIARLAADRASAGLVLDFDGTLAEIVDDPTTSALTDGVADVLAQVTRHLAAVAIVSGRPAAFLGERAAITGVRLLGLYGTEEWTGDGAVPRPEAVEHQPAVDAAAERLAHAIAGHPGLLLENKGLAVALHWRNAPDRDAAGAFVDQIVAEVADATGLAQEPGKFVAELRPSLDWDKGTAVKALAAELDLDTVVYLGDDRGDLPALAAARSSGGAAVVVDHGNETPADVRAAADVILDGPAAVVVWLRRLADALSR